MEVMEDKENVAPTASNDPQPRKRESLSPRKSGRKGRSKSIGPGALEEAELSEKSAKDRRKSLFAPATRSILSKNEESERAARRKSMMNRRVSFAPEATLHTWDIVEYAKDHTTSTDSADSTRRASSFSRSSASPAPSSDASQEDGDAEILSPPATLLASQKGSQERKKRRSSGIPPMNFNNPNDAYSSSGMSGSSEESGSEEDDDGEGSEDETGTAMSLDVDDATIQSAAMSEDSTGSSERLDASLRQAAQTAGTRGIEYDEFGEMSMELAVEEVTNAFKPWARMQPGEPHGSSSLDQENINPFAPAFKEQVHGEGKEEGNEDEDEEDMSMDVTRAVGGILKARQTEIASSPMNDEDGTMELTQAVGKITGQKRGRSTTEAGSPGASAVAAYPKRRRSSVARSSMGDDTMDLTMAVGGIQNTGSPGRSERRRSLRSRRSSGALSEQEDATMEFTQAVGGIRSTGNAAQASADDSFDGNEELSMELTAVLDGIRTDQQQTSAEDSRPVTPQTSQSPVRSVVNTTPKDQERFKDAPDLGAKQLLTPVFRKELVQSVEGQNSLTGVQGTLSPSAQATIAAGQEVVPLPQFGGSSAKKSTHATLRQSPADDVSYPELPSANNNQSPIKTPTSSPRHHQPGKSQSNEQASQLDLQLQATENSPIIAKQLRSSPVKNLTVTPEKPNISVDARDMTSSLKLLTTPRKEALKTVTPKKQSSVKPESPAKTINPRGRPTPKAKRLPRESASLVPSPVQRLNEDLERIKASGQVHEKVGLQDFLTKAGIRFMDLTTTKRRLTVAPTPSKVRGTSLDREDLNLESSVVAAACTVPELELYQHACHELKRYTKEGKQMISDLEAATLREQPPLIRAYTHATSNRKAALDVQMRDMKTDARFRSKELWYAWRSQLLEELLGGLQHIGEGLIKDDETITPLEELLDQVLPGFVQQQASLQKEAELLEEGVNAVTEEEKAELNGARQKLNSVNDELAEKRRVLERLRKQVEEQDTAAEDLQNSKEQFTAAIQEANQVREACRGVSLGEITALENSVNQLEDTHGWSITSASSTPPTVTMCYKSQLELFFHPGVFQHSSDRLERPNAPIRLNYIADSKKPITTTLRFFLQLLRASLQALSQYTTKISDLLALVSNGWDTASAIAEAHRRLNIEALTESRIVSDEQLAIESTILLTKVKTKVRATLSIQADVSEDLRMTCSVEPSVVVVYGEEYNEKNMTEFLRGMVGDGSDGFESWDDAISKMRAKLIVRGAKGTRK